MIRSRDIAAPLAIVPLGGCGEIQSVMNAQGEDAERVLTLAWILFTGGTLIFAAVALIIVLAIFGSPELRRRIADEKMIVYAGAVFPAVTLAALLVYGFALTGAGPRDTPDAAPVRVRVAGELWWWRVTYTDASGQQFESANELHIPVGQTVQIELASDNVIHSFWAPTLAGKLDMIPGRVNRLHVTATAAGISRGQCAEYCGGAHALMSFFVVAHPPEEFSAWLEEARGPARDADTAALAEGRSLFIASGCGGCHAIRGTTANGTIGPDLTHVGSRLSLAAGTLPTSAETFARWIANSHAIKPENRMPRFAIFSETQLAALAGYLASLR